MKPLSDPKAKIEIGQGGRNTRYGEKLCRGFKGNSCFVSTEPQTLDNFSPYKRNADGYSNICRVCDSIRGKEYYQNNRESVLKRTTDYQKKNPEVRRKAGLDFYYRNKELCQAYSKTGGRLNPDKVCAQASRRRSRLKKSMPDWATDYKEEIDYFYWLAKDISRPTGESYHVDHIIPLANEKVCGLHVPWNLQILPSDMNLKKGNSLNV